MQFVERISPETALVFEKQISEFENLLTPLNPNVQKEIMELFEEMLSLLTEDSFQRGMDYATEVVSTLGLLSSSAPPKK